MSSARGRRSTAASGSGGTAGVFTALLEGVIAEAARQGKTDLSLVSVDSTTARAHHDAAGMRIGREVMDALEEAAADRERARQKGAARRNRTDRAEGTPPVGKNMRHIRRRRRLRLKEALLGRSRGGLRTPNEMIYEVVGSLRDR